MPSPIVQIRIPQELLDQAKAQAEADRRSFSAWVRLLIEDRLRVGEYVGITPQQFPSGTWGEGATFTEVRVERAREGMAAEERASVAERPETIIRNMRDGTEASVAQQAEQPAFNRKRAGSSPAGGTGKGSPAVRDTSQDDQTRASRVAPDSVQTTSPSRPIKKGKACKHTNQIRKLGAAFCTDCGEFV